LENIKDITQLDERNATILADPYRYFFEEEEDEIVIDLDSDHNFVDPEVFAVHIKKQLDDAEGRRKSYISKAMRQDPAFMVDPINQYYKHFIPAKAWVQLDEQERKEIMGYYDPVTWGENYLLQKRGGWRPRSSKDGIPFQAQLVRCKSKRIVARTGRRLGKTLSLAVRILHKAFTWVPKGKRSTFNIVIFTPNLSQIKVIFKMFEVLIDDNPVLLDMLKGTENKIPTRQQPQWQLELINGVNIVGFVSGSTSIRGSGADLLVLDEAAYLTESDTESVTALLNDHPNVELWLSSTPTGLKDWFYERCRDKRYVEFHLPSDKFHPFWSKSMEEEFRDQYTSAGYEHEILAEFTADGVGVFAHHFVDLAFNADFEYGTYQRSENCIYSMGVDWNDPQNGTQIKIAEYNLVTKKYAIIDSASVHSSEFTQTRAVEEIKKLNNKWKCAHIYVDKGNGAMQIESIKIAGMQSPKGSPNQNLVNVVGVGFKEVMYTRDPWTKQKIKKETKNLMVDWTVRIFENQHIVFTKKDNLLYQQCLGYVIDRFSAHGVPVYAADSRYGDHSLDATMLALFPFLKESSTLIKPSYETIVHEVPQMRALPSRGSGPQTVLTELDRRIMKDKLKEKKEYQDAHATSSLSILNRSGINPNEYKRGSSQNKINKRLSKHISRRATF
jgi:hypothetical protein